MSTHFSRWGERKKSQVFQLVQKVLLSNVGVFLLSPLRNKHSDFSMSSAPKCLYSDGNSTTRKDPMESMPGETKH